MMISKSAQEEICDQSRSTTLRSGLDAVTGSPYNSFQSAGNIDVDAYYLFVSEFNEFINHELKLFACIQDSDMRLW